MKQSIIFDLLKKAIKPAKVQYTILDDSTKATSASQGKNYKIICQSPKKPLPFTFEQIEALDAEQVEDLQTMLELRRRKRELEKKTLVYKSLLKKFNN